MVIRAIEIKDRDSLERWLTEWPVSQGMSEAEARQVAVQIAHRTAVRVLPLAWAVYSNNKVRKSDKDALSLLRCLARSAGASTCPLSEVSKFFDTYIAEFLIFDLTAHDAAAFACEAICLPNFASNAAFTIDAANTAAETTLWSYVSNDCVVREAERGLADVSLWPDSYVLKIDHAEGEFKDNLSSEHAVWNFWLKFYDRSKRGEISPWELLLAVVDIPEQEWGAGPVRIAELIARIELEWLHKEVAKHKNELVEIRQTHASAVHRSHNQPPELVEDDVKAAKAITLVWEVLDEAETELEQETPDPSKLRELSLKLWAALKVIAAYCGKKADKALDKSVEVVGEAGTKWAIRVTAGSIAARQLPLERIAQGLADVAKNLGF